MKFAKLYKDNCEAVEQALLSMWCNETANDSQRAYVEQLKKLIRTQLFAPENAVPLVQCMNSYEAVHSVSTEEAKVLLDGLWTRTEAPFEHQYQCWDTLLNRYTPDGLPMSICVTTGTGSGKTECFMMPLVSDLKKNGEGEGVKAIFLYPLNALMDDQKERLEKLLADSDLTYTVYNGDLPDDMPSPKDKSKAAERLRERVRRLRGEYVDDNGEIKYKYPKFVYTRKLVRKNPPDIILTNPTMLEYILLRKKDESITDPAKKSLKWVVLDETHTYTGAGAAEMAMLLRRVLLAFGVLPQDVRFATSSATFGNGADPKKERKQLQEFISGITGTGLDQVAVVEGKRQGENIIRNPHCVISEKDRRRWLKIFQEDFVSLDQLFPEGSIEEKLEKLDAMCERVPMQGDIPLLKAKAHFFYRVPNNGLFVRLSEHSEGAFVVRSINDINKEELVDNPLLELSRCKNCGEYVALTLVQTRKGADQGKYEALGRDDSDMFDIEDINDDEADKKYYIIGLSKDDTVKGDNNIKLRLNGDRLLPDPSVCLQDEWHLVANTQCCCPHCNCKLTHKANEDEAVGSQICDATTTSYLQKFRISPEFISRILAPSILNNLEKGYSKNPQKITLHDGQQYISFSDSRQLAARSTLKQNIDQERMWFLSTLYHELNRRKAEAEKIKEEIKKWRAIVRTAESDEEADAAAEKVRELKAKVKDSMTWREVADLFLKDKYLNTYCEQFVRRSGDSEEIDKDGIPYRMLEKYVHSIMVEYLSRRPASALAAETMGLFHMCYPQLDNIKDLPQAVIDFNGVLSDECNQISIADWKNYLRLFIDFNIRNMQSVFLKLSDTNPIDIFACERFAAEKPRRTPAKKPAIDRNQLSRSRMVRLLCALIMQDNPSLNLKSAYDKHFDHISGVIDAMWEYLTHPDSKVLEQAQYWDKDNDCFEYENAEESWRMNLVNMSVKLYDEAWMADTNSDSSIRHTERLRPIPYTFKGFSPYLVKNEVAIINPSMYEVWDFYTYFQRSGEEINQEKLLAWAKEHRNLLLENGMWGENGLWSDRYDEVYLFPNLFIQAEHTAQVDKEVTRSLQDEFKDHTINILSCSTTMEMGVDLGNLEVVLLNSVPPTPANYKQRVGRSGRNNRVSSACITLCGSDMIGLRTLFNPLENIIKRPVNVPTVDLQSPQVVQRHINSYLIRSFGVFGAGDHGGRITQSVIDYYTTYHLERSGDHMQVKDQYSNIKTPKDKLGDEDGTPYALFNLKCSQPLSDQMRSDILELLKGTVFEGNPEHVVAEAQASNERRYQELSIRLEDYGYAYEEAKNIPKEKTRIGFQAKMMIQYIEALREQLLSFWATHRFTPNANMPVNVLTLDLNSSKRDYYSSSTSSNPSYGLRDALAQYTPGNSIIVDGVAYVARGIEFTDQYQGTRSFKKIYRNTDKCVIDDPTLDPQVKWEVNGKKDLELIQPTQFVPDINEERSRITANNDYTHVNAQLIGTADWDNNATEPHLFSVRNNRDSGDAKILYYNEGKGFGYCFCPKCGKMVLETAVAPEDNVLGEIPREMNPIKPKTPGKRNYHYSISSGSKRQRCIGSMNAETTRRNVIIGDLIQTDYAEIRIRHKGQKTWMRNRNEDPLLFTLAIVFKQTLLDILGKERGAVDFTIMPNGHICIFDTNPGGAGYSNQLVRIPLMNQVIQASKRLLEAAKASKSKDMLLDKFTMRYIKNIDIDAALNWIREEEESRNKLPEEIEAISSNAAETDLSKLYRAIESSHQPMTLFVDDKYSNWDYNGTDHGWRKQVQQRIISKGGLSKLCVLKSESETIPSPALIMLRGIKDGWINDVVEAENPYAGTSVYPIAYVDGYLYLCNNPDFSSFNSQWGAGTLYCSKVDCPVKSVKEISCETVYSDSVIFKLSGSEDSVIKSTDLGGIIQNHASEVIGKFLNHAKNSGSLVKIKYQDEHLKSVMGMVLALQIIDHFVKQMENPISLEFAVEKYDTGDTVKSITTNIGNSRLRDMHLTDLAKAWAYDLEINDGIICTVNPVISKERNQLTHWRELSMECEGLRLSIYPDGGFVNEWSLDRTSGANPVFRTLDNTDAKTIITIRRIKDIKMDVTIEEV